MKITKEQIKQIHIHLPKEAKTDKDFKAGLVAQFSEKGKTSTKDLTHDEANLMIASLSGSYGHYAFFDMHSKSHNFLLSLCYEARDKDGNSPYVRYCEKKKRTIPDLEALGKWIAHRSKYRKPLKELSPHQTGIVINQFEKVVKFGYGKV